MTCRGSIRSSRRVDFAYLLREAGRPLRAVHDQHIHGVFRRADWLRLLSDAGFVASAHPVQFDDDPPGQTMFVALRPA